MGGGGKLKLYGEDRRINKLSNKITHLFINYGNVLKQGN